MNEIRNGSKATRPPLTGGILAGGRGSRLGGRDKGLIEWRGKPMVAHVIERLAPQVDGILISANRNLDDYRRFGYPVVSDALDGFQGPLAGFAALLAACPTDWLVTAPCDSPLLPPDLVARLWARQVATGAEIVIAHDGQRRHPAHALLSRRLRDDLEDFLAGGERRIGLWYARRKMEMADFSDCPEAFANINNSNDFAALETAPQRE